MRNKVMKRGFTLIELLVVIAVLGTLAVVVLLALNPLQQLARTRDSGRISATTQLGHALEAYATSHNGTYVPESTTWIQTLVDAGEIQAVPAAINYSVAGSSPCTLNAHNNICYDATTAAGGAPVVVYATLESDSNNSYCSGTEVAYSVYSTADGRGGIVCSTSAPTPGSQTFAN